MSLLKIRYVTVAKLFEFQVNNNLHEQALQTGMKAAELYEQLIGSDCFELADYYARFGAYAYSLKSMDDAERLYRRSIEIAGNSSDAPVAEVISIMNHLGTILERQGKTTEALDIYQRALRLAHAHLHPSDRAFKVLEVNVCRCGGTPYTMARELGLSEKEKLRERQDQALRKAVAIMNRQFGSADVETPVGRRINSELEYWCLVGNVGKVKLALQGGEDINQRWSDGRTALHTAASGNKPDLIKLLLLAGADRNARLTTGETALDLACAHGFEEAASYLRIANQFS